jgi:DnaJ-class molecular chaperone
MEWALFKTMSLQVDLADLYNGKVKKLAINRKVPVNPDEKPKACDACDTRGVRMMTRQIGPGMIQQMQVVCDNCGGMGYQVKMKQERHILECNIEKVCQKSHFAIPALILKISVFRE